MTIKEVLDEFAKFTQYDPNQTRFNLASARISRRCFPAMTRPELYPRCGQGMRSWKLRRIRTFPCMDG